ncbi:MAG: hypothetical protein E7040_02215 [Lentisphaerae bacterium]|nr:hypothetical protein [Lentisphaerota bacterium]
MNHDLFPSDELIRRAGTGDLDAAVELDHAGFLVQPGENAETYAARIAEVKKHGLQFYDRFDKKGKLEIFPGLNVNLKNQIPQEILEEATARTEEAYQFSVRWVPGFFPDREFGIFWGGCAVWEEENPTPVIVIRKNFAKRAKWFIYDRAELISHEFCHAARMPLMDQELEEHFAYGISKKWLRRAIGNCFQRDLDAILFVIPAVLLALVQTVITVMQLNNSLILPFWVLALAWPLYLIVRNIIQTGKYKAAKRNLEKAGFRNARAILFRSVYEEICTFAKTKPEQLRTLLEEKAEQDFRWNVILQLEKIPEIV